LFRLNLGNIFHRKVIKVSVCFKNNIRLGQACRKLEGVNRNLKSAVFDAECLLPEPMNVVVFPMSSDG
jgi:hypothetical protein